MRKFVAAALCAAGVLVGGQAAATPIVYTLAGSGSGSLNGTNFTNASYVFTLSADTSEITSSTFFYAIETLDSVTASIDGFGLATFTEATRFGQVPNLGFFFGSPTHGDILDSFSSAIPDMSMAFGPFTGNSATTDNQFKNLATDLGALTLNSTSLFSISATGGDSTSTLPPLKVDPPGPITPPRAVPEPDMWALMILGFGASGVALRRRRRTVSPSA